MREERPDSEQMLKRFKYEEEQKQKKAMGKLKIFLGYAAGSGKTYTMLEAAHEAMRHGVDIVAGYIEPHDRPDTMKLMEGLEMLPLLRVEYRGVHLREFDLDAALERRPKLILVDELAHTNAPGLRNEKRYQDVKELLRAGINVYTTMNIQHLESLNDIVGNITGITVRERVPDHIFDQADRVEVIDIEPEDLIDRMKEGKIYQERQSEMALQHFFRREKLVALREITLRRTADRVNRIAEKERQVLGNTDYHTGEHVLVCISPAESNDKVIRTASRLAYAFRAEFTALYVETPRLQEADEKTKRALRNRLELAKVLGANIVTVFGLDVGSQIAEYAIVGNISKIVIGRTNHKMWEKSLRQELLERLTEKAPNVDVYIIPDMRPAKTYRKNGREGKKKKTGKVVLELLEITCLLLVTTGAAYVLKQFHLPESNLIMIYILGVLLSSYIAEHYLYAVYSSFISVLLFNFFFTEPYFTLKAYDKGYTTTFILLFCVGLFTATLTRNLKRQNEENAKKAYRTEILLENSQKLRRCKTEMEVWEQLGRQVGKLLDLPLLIYPVGEDGLLKEVKLFPGVDQTIDKMKEYTDVQERAVAQWVVANHHRAGACTHTLSNAKAMYIPVQDADNVRGVLGVVLKERRQIQEFKYGLLIAMLNETGVKLQNSAGFPE